jgi:hypothetical protein
LETSNALVEAVIVGVVVVVPVERVGVVVVVSLGESVVPGNSVVVKLIWMGAVVK